MSLADKCAILYIDLCLNSKSKKDVIKYYVKFCRYLFFCPYYKVTDKNNIIKTFSKKLNTKYGYNLAPLVCETLYPLF